MTGLWILVPLLVLPLVLFLAWLLLSSCLGNAVRSRVSRSSVPGQQPSFGRHYAMNLSSGAGQGGWEQIEMENMLNPDDEFGHSSR